jgi:hypothetical protein
MSQDGKKYIDLALTILERINTINSDDQKWKHVVTKENTELYKKKYPDICPIPCYLTTTTIGKPMNELVNKIWLMDEDKAKENDPKLTMWTEIDKGVLDDNISWKVCSQYNSMMWPIWPRHIVFAQVKINRPATSDKPETTQLVAFSVDHEKAPIDTKTHVQAIVHLSVYDFISNKDGSTIINRITQVDPKGGIPVGLINMYATNQVDMFNRWKK